MSERPQFEIENELAESLGWHPIKDMYRYSGFDANWCWFLRGNQHVWTVNYPRWVRAEFHKDHFINHKHYDSLEEALRGI